MFANPASRFVTVAVVEAISWAGLLSGMYVKYLGSGNQLGVHVFGTVHGVVFLGYLAVVFAVRKPLAWDRRTTVLAVLAGVPPFGSLVFERWARRTRRLDMAVAPAS
ncbi:MAG: DUF3817 domain-containing protein [Kutzneria sp.]|nr:DUF3817 domain-containing protein [Kutzneria sp.]MBV9846310.1 DUF3817 domain-containing protein [Kutzneria sp.]